MGIFFRNIFFMEHLLETASEMRVLRKMAKWHSCYKEISWSLQLFHRTDFVRKSVYFHELFRERQYYTYKKFFINYSKKKAKSLKYSSKGILLLIKLQLKGLQFWVEIKLNRIALFLWWKTYHSFARGGPNTQEIVNFQVSSDPFGPVILTKCKFLGNSIHQAVSAM